MNYEQVSEAARSKGQIAPYLRNYTVERTSSISEAMLTGGQLTEVACCPGHRIVKELENNSASWLRVDGDIKLQRWSAAVQR